MAITHTKRCLFAMIVLASACAGQGASSGNDRPDAPVRANSSVITREDILTLGSGEMSALDVVKRLRPMFLAPRSALSTTNTEAGRTHASIDGIRVVPLDDLNNVQASSIAEITFLDAGRAMQKFGTRANRGAVIVIRLE